MTLDESIRAMRLRVIHRAQGLGSVTAACQEAGISRTVFYRWRKRFERYGADGLHPRRHRARRGRPPEVPPHVERLVVGLSLAWPTWGCGRLAAHLAQQGLAQLAPSTVQRCLRRVGLADPPGAPGGPGGPQRDGRPAHRADPPGAPAGQASGRHVAAEQPGDLVCLDTFYLGKLKGVGKVWQVTACDAACSYGAAQILPALSATACAAFLRDVLSRCTGGPAGRSSACSPTAAASSRGPSPAACRTLGIRHTRTKPRHAWTNGFVERLQGTLLQEHWRIQFRRRYFTSRLQLQRTLEAFLHFYNTQRPHSGYRLRGRTPASLFWGAVGQAAS